MKSVRDYSSYRSRQNRRHSSVKGNKKVTFKDIVYCSVVLVIIFSFVSSQHSDTPTPSVPATKVATVFAMDYPTLTSTPTPTLTSDERVSKVFQVLSENNSPLAPYAAYMVAQADRYGIDYTLMPSISHKESSYGKSLPTGSHNPFGLGGDNFMWFDSWTDAIDYEAKLLSKDYRYNSVSAIGAKYCPASDNCASDWAEVVTATQYEIINK